MKSLRNWNVVKLNSHDISGIENPENWMYERIDGIFYPVEEIEIEVEDTTEIDRMIDELDPDWTDEQMVEHGWEVKVSKLMGEDIIDWREGCGHDIKGLNSKVELI